MQSLTGNDIQQETDISIDNRVNPVLRNFIIMACEIALASSAVYYTVWWAFTG